jgi:DNA polymerase-3 subunit alpha
MAFVHLRLHSEYSIADGIVRLKDAVAAAENDNQPALALTDLNNTFGFIKFYRAARAKGVKPVLGTDVFVTNENERDRPYRVLLLIQNEKGYKNLCELLSQAFLSNSYKDRAEIRFDWLKDLSEGLICLSGGSIGEVGQCLLTGSAQSTELARNAAQRYAQVFGDRFYLEVQRAGFADDERLLRQTVALAIDTQIGMVATHPVQFLKPEDYRSHEARVCIAQGDTLANPKRQRLFTEEQYLKSSEEMTALFHDLPVAIENTLAIAQRCNFTMNLGTPQLPNFPTPHGESLEDYLRLASREGLEKRLLQRHPEAALREERRSTYQARLELECDTIIQMGFPGYFLIVADFINWAKNNGVPVGPGRGSGAGSLVAFSLGITDLDPLPYSLLFERFLNPERVSMPDFDIDFCQEKRQRVIDYVRERYGRDAVSQIVTFGTMASRAVIRDAGRVLDLPYNLCDQLSKLIPVVQAKPLSLEEAREKEPILAEREKKEDEVRELLVVARPLEDLVRNVGMHAGGVLIAPGKLTDFCPLYQAPGSKEDEGVVSMYDKDDVEAAGLVKFDFLGLKNLTIIQAAVDTINTLYKGAMPHWGEVADAAKPTADSQSKSAPRDTLSLEDLNGFDDPAAYQILKDANTTGIFQVESAGMRRYLVKLAPDQFEDIIAMLALYRPGPLNSGMVDDFILRKRGQQAIDYFHSNLKDCLAPTYGVIVYQEQVMQIAQIIAGYSLGGADLLRRAMGKKKPEEMAQQRSIFLEGALKKGHTEKLAAQLFDLMEKFAEYGFNKSHTAAYAVITYQTAWLKAHYPAEFMAATLSADMDDTDKVAFLVADAKANGLAVLPPDINASRYRFEPVVGASVSDGEIQTEEDFYSSRETITRSAPTRDPSPYDSRQKSRTIRYGLGAIRGVGESAVMNILKARENGPFTDLFNFCARVDRKLVNKRAMEALVKSGAFDALHPRGRQGRAQLVAGITLAVQVADTAEAQAHQGGLFDDFSDSVSSGTNRSASGTELGLSDTAPFTVREALLEEKLALGYCFSGSLFDDVRDELQRFAPNTLARLLPSRDPVWVAGVVVDSRGQMTRRGMMRVVTIDDGTARLDITVFNEIYEQRKSVLKNDEPLLLCARIENDEFSGGLRGAATEILTLTDARLRYAKGIAIELESDSFKDQRLFNEFLQELTQTLAPQLVSDSLGSGVSQAPVTGAKTGVATESASNSHLPGAMSTAPVFISIEGDQEVCTLALGRTYAVTPSPDQLQRLSQLPGARSAALVY